MEICDGDDDSLMRMGNKHSSKPDSAAQSSAVSRNGSQKKADAVESASSSSSAAQAPGFDLDYASAQPIQLSSYQKALLREAWQRINKKGTGNIGSLIFRRMFSKNPEIKQVFQHVTVIEGVFGFGLTPIQAFHQHSVLFVNILDGAIKELDDLRPFVKKCVQYGAAHAPYRKYGFKADMWDIFGECMTEAAREWEGWKKHRETIRAWTILISFIVDRMRQGFESAVRREGFATQVSKQQSVCVDDGEDVKKNAASHNQDDAGSAFGKQQQQRQQLQLALQDAAAAKMRVSPSSTQQTVDESRTPSRDRSYHEEKN